MRSKRSARLWIAAVAGFFAAASAGAASAAYDNFLWLDGVNCGSDCKKPDPPPPKPHLFPDGAPGFSFTTTGGTINPGIEVGFNPLSDPMGAPQTSAIFLSNWVPELSNTWTGAYTLEFALTGLGTSVMATPAAPDANGVTSFQTTYDGHVFEVTMGFQPGPDPASWAGFNPQPDPPGDFVAIAVQFPQDAAMAFFVTEDGNPLALSAAPEPATWALMFAGLALLGATLRQERKRGRKQVAQRTVRSQL